MAENEIEYSIVIPVYNSEKSLEELIENLIQCFDKISKIFEIICVDDGSKDNSWLKLESLHEKYNQVKIVQLLRNYGQHNALLCGFNCAKGKFILTSDDDLQNPAEEIPKLIKEMKEKDVDVVTGTRFDKKQPFYKNFAGALFDYLFCKIFNKPRDLSFGSMNLIKREIINEIIKETTPNPILVALILKNTLKISSVTIKHNKRKYGRSNYSLSKLLSLYNSLVINYSTYPLKIVNIIGFIAAFGGFIGLGYILYSALMGNVGVSGWASTISLIILFGGINLLALGIIGEYLARIFREIGSKDQFKIRIKKL